MRVRLAYGTSGLEVTLPDRNVAVIRPEHPQGIDNELEAVREALRNPIGCAPLRDSVKATDTVVIVFPDGTRAMPLRRVLPPLLAELSHVPRERIALLNALGTHRPNTHDELVSMLGEDVVAGYRILQHDCDDRQQLTRVGTLSSGEPLFLNRTYVEASFRIVTGLIEPHFFAGFSGGPKAILPGLAARENVIQSHAADLIAHPDATWCITDGNPVFERMLEAARLAPPQFCLNVSVNRERALTGVFAGELVAAHSQGAAFVGAQCRRRVDRYFDIVLTSNSGFPLDQNLYQAVKGMSAAARVVREGGAIIVAAECRDGIPAHGNYGRLLKLRGTPAELLALIRTPGFVMSDQWQVQIQAQVQQRARVYVKSDYLSESDIRDAKLLPCVSIEDTLAQLLAEYGPDAAICVLPEGPETVPYVG
ncbi:MAG: nickel-dependent lactate racemase [Betaproteobacteria bacterium]